MHLSRVVAAAVALSAGCSIAAMQAIAETVGKAVSVKTMVTGDRGELKRADPVSRDERYEPTISAWGNFNSSTARSSPLASIWKQFCAGLTAP